MELIAYAKEENLPLDFISWYHFSVIPDYLLTAKVGKKGKVRIRKNNKMGKIIVNAVNSGEKVELMI